MKLVTVYSSNSLPEIYVVKGILESEGIPAFTKDELITQTAPYLSTGFGKGIQLQVPENKIIDAVNILQDKNYLKPQISSSRNNIKSVIIFMLALLAVLMIYLWVKNWSRRHF